MPDIHVIAVPIDRFLSFTHRHAILRSLLFLQKCVWDLMYFPRVRVRVRVCVACVFLSTTFLFRASAHQRLAPHLFGCQSSDTFSMSWPPSFVAIRFAECRDVLGVPSAMVPAVHTCYP